MWGSEKRWQRSELVPQRRELGPRKQAIARDHVEIVARRSHGSGDEFAQREGAGASLGVVGARGGESVDVDLDLQVGKALGELGERPLADGLHVADGFGQQQWARA